MATGNHFIDSLAADDASALAPLLKPVRLEAGQVLIEQDGAVDTVHFPIEAMLANVVRLDEGASVETAIVGREGVSGLAPVMSSTPCSWEVVTRRAGSALSLPAVALQRRLGQSEPFRERLLILTSHYQSQAAQTAACNSVHRVSQRLARWLLTAAELSGDERVDLTQEELSALLGAQRTTVTEAAQGLKAAGALAYSRGVVTISDREGMERAACGCFASERDRMRRLKLTL